MAEVAEVPHPMAEAPAPEWADAVGYSMLKCVKMTVGGECPRCLKPEKDCRGQKWCPKWKKWRDCDIVSDETCSTR